LRREDGVTLLEIMVVVALVAVFAVLALPSISAYKRRQDAREHTQRVAGMIANARSLAVKEGNPYFVLVDPNTGNLQIVDDDNGDWQITGGELTTTVTYTAGAHPDVTLYNLRPSPPAATLVPEEGPGPIPGSGTSFPTDVSGTPGVGFTSQGFPVSLPTVVGGNPGAPGTGQGSYYVTDNANVVYAMTLLPLGGIRVRVYRPQTNDWF
jgi:prepilin-type N-terminal cleavage/methylation domain-containing protein